MMVEESGDSNSAFKRDLLTQNGDDSMQASYLYKEENRLGTFATYPTSAAMSAVVLAQSGFAYTGTGRDGDDRVTCVFCQAVRSSWRPEEDVEEVHRTLSPNCTIVTGQNSGNVPIVYSSSRSFQELLNAASSIRSSDSTPNRRENCNTEHTENLLGATNLTESENTSTQSSSKQNTSTTNSSIAQNTSSINSLTQNVRNNNNNIANGPTYSELGIVTDRPKRPEYALKSERLKTFSNWPRDHHPQPSELADAGFFYAGYGDCARCFYCGGGLRNWHDEDDVWVEHARMFSKCSFIRQRMGQVFVDTVQDLNKTLDKFTYEAVANKMGVAALSAYRLYSGLSAGRLLARLKQERGDKVHAPRPQVNQSASNGASNDSGQVTATCFCCEGTHGDWKGFDCIWVEHARYFPGCALLKLQMGQDFIDTVQKLSLFKDQITLQNVRTDMEASGTLCHFSHILSFKISQRPDQNSQNVLQNSMLSKEQDISNERDKERLHQTKCKVCQDNEVEAVFLNCGHLVCCAECAIVLRECPVCKEAIIGLVRAFIP